VRRVADAAEQGGALWLANAMLAEMERAGTHLPALEIGRVLAQRARVARKADAADMAENLYKRVARIGREAEEPELTARAAIGLGVLAQVRGNLPSAARHFARAARIGARGSDAEVIWLAEHGQMVTAAKRGAFADALRHGWTAFMVARGNREREADMLLNLAQLAFDTGHPLPAMHAFAAALDREPGPHLMLPALGGAARAASALGRTDIVRWCADRLEIDTPSGSFAYPTASAMLDVALALGGNAPRRARAVAERALELTERFGFHELEHHLRTLQMELEHRASFSEAEPPATVMIGPQGNEILRHIEQLEGDLLGSTTM
jgi:tetratricopeptide (TPR) repeat protein